MFEDLEIDSRKGRFKCTFYLVGMDHSTYTLLTNSKSNNRDMGHKRLFRSAKWLEQIL